MRIRYLVSILEKLFGGGISTQTILTKREKQVFELLIKNYNTKEIASIMCISDKTVRNHISNVMLKLAVKGRAQAVVELLKLKELSID